MNKEDKPFEWTDELVKEFNNFWMEQFPHYMGASYYPQVVEKFKQSKVAPLTEQKERIEVTNIWRAAGGISTLDGAPFNSYHFNSKQLIPPDKFPLIKEAIERVINEDTVVEDMKDVELFKLIRDNKALKSLLEQMTNHAEYWKQLHKKLYEDYADLVIKTMDKL